MSDRPSIARIVADFREMDDEERYLRLSDVMAGEAVGEEIHWRARLATALRDYWPKRKYSLR